jgi:alkanesulfonate monooxygenase SsuD/methylene tetrahydromethanopterin reductase-like flavin-dependent oxidoreductase (luciferase family)
VTALRFDLRRAPTSSVSEAEQYRECIEMVRWAEGRGITQVVLSEHHGVDFVSAPTTLAGVLLGATSTTRVLVNALLVTLHDPVRLAEQVATLDVTSGGRFTFVAGLGYRHEEFEMAGIDRSRRGAIVEEHVGVLRQAWTGEPFEWRGRRVEVHPALESPVEQVLWMGGSVRRSAERAARMRLPFFTMSTNPAVLEMYAEACAEVGYDTGFAAAPSGPLFVHVSEDPEADWATIGPFAEYDARTYNAWQTGDHDNVAATSATTAAALRGSGMWRVVTPDECVALVEAHGFVALHPLMGGMPPALGWRSLELLVDQVLPRTGAA